MGPLMLAKAVKRIPSPRAIVTPRVRSLLPYVLHQLDVKLVDADSTSWEISNRQFTRETWEMLAKALKLPVPPSSAPIVCGYGKCAAKEGKLARCGGCHFYAYHAECARLCVTPRRLH